MRRSALLLPLVLLLAATPNDPLASAIERLEVKNAADALHQGRRTLAMFRLAAAWADAEAKGYAGAHKTADLQAEWKAKGRVVRAAQKLDDIRPAALRALAEEASLESRGYYDASLDYGNNTNPQEGFYYLGKALAERSFIEFAQSISEGPAKAAPHMRSIAPDIDALERELLAAYRPPDSIDKHGMFIGASAMLKEARELDAAGLRYGALLRYLDAAHRLGLITGPGTGGTLDLPDDGVDHSIAQIYVEAAQASPEMSTMIASRVLPRYLAAIGPAPAPKPRVNATHTVTLVRWPYT